jgi:hypothetical protein
MTVLTDPSRPARAHTEGPKFVSDRFGLERMIRETLEIYGMASANIDNLKAQN